MANTSPSVNMNLPVPVTGVDPGPDYANNVNACFTLLDSHDHAPGRGVQITPNGLNINAALPFNNNFIVSAAGITLRAQTIVPANNTVYENGVDLYFTDGNGNNVRITQSGAVAGTPGSIANLTSPASAAFVSGSSTFVFQSNTNTAGNIDGGSFIFRNLTASSKGVTVSPPTSLPADYSLVLPHLPSSVTEVLTIDTSGNIAPGFVSQALMASDAQQALNPPGAIIMFGGASAPAGYLLCDGSSVAAATYPALFAAIGTAYGTVDAGTHFNIPDFRGYFPRGVSGASGNDPNASSRTAVHTGGATGNNVGSAQAFEVQVHTHQIIIGNEGGGITTTIANSFPQGGGNSVSGIVVNDGGAETRPLNLYVNFVIKT